MFAIFLLQRVKETVGEENEEELEVNKFHLLAMNLVYSTCNSVLVSLLPNKL